MPVSETQIAFNPVIADVIGIGLINTVNVSDTPKQTVTLVTLVSSYHNLTDCCPNTFQSTITVLVPLPETIFPPIANQLYVDPLVFNADSMLGVPGLLSVYRNGGVTLANAVGTGVADDKATYIYVPEMIKFYLGEAPLLENVPTYELSKEKDLQYTLEHLHELVVKEVQGSGGYGMLVGPAATKQEIEEFRLRIVSKPANYIAQPTLALSTCPTLVEAGIAPRHVDLRPFVLSGKTVTLVPGALCRVALKEGSLVVNSSQGGGTKDTWVLENDVVSENSAVQESKELVEKATKTRSKSKAEVLC